MKKVLIIEDDEAIAKALSGELKDAGFEVLRSADGESGLEAALVEEPDLILLDIILPKIDGISILESVKENNESKDIPVLMLTNLDSMEKISEAMELGAKGYVVKSEQTISDIVEKVRAEIG